MSLSLSLSLSLSRNAPRERLNPPPHLVLHRAPQHLRRAPQRLRRAPQHLRLLHLPRHRRLQVVRPRFAIAPRDEDD